MAVKDYLAAAAATARGDAVEKDRASLLGRKLALERSLRTIRQSMADVRAIDETADVSGFAQDYAREAAVLVKVNSELQTLPEARKITDALPNPAEAAARVAASLRRIPEALASSVMAIAEKRSLLDAVLLRAVPIEGTHGARNSVDWGIDITLRPTAWNVAAQTTASGMSASSAG